MAILNLTDKETYFPHVDVAMPALQGLIALAQVICESAYGANRLLEAQGVSEILVVRNQQVFLSYAPVMAITSVSMRWSQQRWGRTVLSDWSPLPDDGYRFDSPINRLHLFMPTANEVKVSYTTGFDFSSSSSDVQKIKAIAGLVVDWAARRYYGQLDSYLINPSVDGAAAESWNFVRPDQYLQALSTGQNLEKVSRKGFHKITKSNETLWIRLLNSDVFCSPIWPGMGHGLGLWHYF